MYRSTVYIINIFSENDMKKRSYYDQQAKQTSTAVTLYRRANGSCLTSDTRRISCLNKTP